MKLTKYEKDIETEILTGESKSLSPKDRSKYQSIFKQANKVKKINIRLLEEDLNKIRLKADKEGLPYQSLIGSVLHKFINGNLIDLEDMKKVHKVLKFV